MAFTQVLLAAATNVGRRENAREELHVIAYWREERFEAA